MEHQEFKRQIATKTIPQCFVMKYVSRVIERYRFIPKWMQPFDLSTSSQHSDNRTATRAATEKVVSTTVPPALQ
jgi:hypothetical protein